MFVGQLALLTAWTRGPAHDRALGLAPHCSDRSRLHSGPGLPLGVHFVTTPYNESNSRANGP